jgi:RNase adaptor protein for sRNA GlmZ degradation
VAIGGRGILLRGAPGAGKSDLALRLIAQGAILVADDQVDLAPEDGRLIASPPPTIAGLIELRGFGIRRLAYLPRVALRLVADLVMADEIDRLPPAAEVAIDGIVLPLWAVAPFEASTPMKLALASAADAEVGYLDIEMSDVHPASPECAAAVSPPDRPRVVLITGMSGAGRTTALKMLEDMGYEAVDNLPLSFLPRLVAGCTGPERPIAVGIDIRTRDFGVGTVLAELGRLIQDGSIDCKLVFVDCDEESLARRYTETRRRHPLAGDRPVLDGIRLERDLVSPLRERADLLIDTSTLHSAELKRILAGNFALHGAPGLRIFVTSFSYRQGLPREADLVFDVRFLKNPYYVPDLRHLSGLDGAVAAFIAADPDWDGFFAALTLLLRRLLPRYDREGKTYLTIAIGCTGGRHRSVYAALRLAEWLESEMLSASVAHRDIDRPLNAQDVEPPRAALPAGAAHSRMLE